MEALTLPSPTKGWKADAGFLGRWILLGAGAGAISGALIGGVGGRIAMLVLRLTSSDLLRGAITDDGFEIGAGQRPAAMPITARGSAQPARSPWPVTSMRWA